MSRHLFLKGLPFLSRVICQSYFNSRRDFVGIAKELGAFPSFALLHDGLRTIDFSRIPAVSCSDGARIDPANVARLRKLVLLMTKNPQYSDPASKTSASTWSSEMPSESSDSKVRCQKHDVRSRSTPWTIPDRCRTLPRAHVNQGGVLGEQGFSPVGPLV